MKKRMLAFALVLVLAFCAMPVSFAAERETSLLGYDIRSASLVAIRLPQTCSGLGEAPAATVWADLQTGDPEISVRVSGSAISLERGTFQEGDEQKDDPLLVIFTNGAINGTITKVELEAGSYLDAQEPCAPQTVTDIQRSDLRWYVSAYSPFWDKEQESYETLGTGSVLTIKVQDLLPYRLCMDGTEIATTVGGASFETQYTCENAGDLNLELRFGTRTVETKKIEVKTNRELYRSQLGIDIGFMLGAPFILIGSLLTSWVPIYGVISAIAGPGAVLGAFGDFFKLLGKLPQVLKEK